MVAVLSEPRKALPRKALRRRPNNEIRTREYLTPEEVARLIRAAGAQGRHGHRDSALIMLAYRHGLRVSELVILRWEQLDFNGRVLYVTRRKNGTASIQPLGSPELRALRRLQKEYPATPYVFVTERGGPLTTHTVRKIVARAGRAAGIVFPVHPHMLRHACGYYMVNRGIDTRTIQSYLGHKQIQHTVKYTELAANRFNALWDDHSNRSLGRDMAAAQSYEAADPEEYDRLRYAANRAGFKLKYYRGAYSLTGNGKRVENLSAEEVLKTLSRRPIGGTNRA